MTNYVSFENMMDIVDDLKSYIDNKIGGKQDKLEAGDGISIVNNIISTANTSFYEINGANWRDFLVETEYLVEDGSSTKKLDGYTLVAPNNAGVYYFTEEIASLFSIDTGKPIVRIGRWTWNDDDELNEYNGNRITLMGHFKLGFVETPIAGNRASAAGGVIPMYYANTAFDTEKWTVEYEGARECSFGSRTTYLLDNSNKPHFIDLMCWKCAWYTKGYIK